MTLAEALDIVVERTHHERYRWLCSDDNPDAAQRDGYRRLVMQQMTDEPAMPAYPSLWEQAGNAAKAAAGVVSAVAHGQPVAASEEEQARRLAICHACEFFDATQGRCTKCGCLGAWKTWVASQRCPLEPPKW
jgi:hypothetical protein